MHPGRSGRSLGERAASSGVAAAAAGPRDTGPPGAEPAEGRHCWVHDPPGAPGRWPGLLVEWRQRGGAWQGRVVYTVAGPHDPALVEAWLPAALLRPR
jgi:hypothetical protein